MALNLKKEIDEILLEAGTINIQQIKKVWDTKRETKQEIAEIILSLGFASKADIFNAMATKMEVDFIDLSEYKLEDPELPLTINRDVLERYVLVPIQKSDGVLTVAMKDPTDIYALDDLKISTGFEIRPVLSESELILQTIKNAFYIKEQKELELKAEEERKERERQEKENREREEKERQQKEREQKEKEESEERKRQEIEREERERLLKEEELKKLEKKEASADKDKLGGLLLNEGLITREQLDDALSTQKKQGGLFGQILLSKGYIEKKKLFEFLEIQLGIKHVDLEEIEIPSSIRKLVDEKICKRYVLAPFEIDGITLKVAMSDPLNIFSIDDLRLVTGMEIIPYLADDEQINTAIEKIYSKEAAQELEEQEDPEPAAVQDFDAEMRKINTEIESEMVQQNEEETIEISDISNAPIVRMVNIILNKAIAGGASDIHIEPQENSVLIRYRIDGQLVEIMKHEKRIHPSLVARIKIISGLNIAEKRVPQDGRITLKLEKSVYDLRVSVLPTIFGEKIVMRIQDKEGFNVSKKDLGFFEDDMAKFDEILSHPHGIVLVTGPTGSGKSTTLYTALNELSKPNVNILTVEDPVESTVKGINQVQVNVKAGMTFASALRSFLRQDPDIIMVGEIRDGETAEIAIRAAITGHLVLSTLHTNDAASTISRIIDMGIEPFLISSSVVGVIAQRLVRRLCVKCKEEYEPDLNEREVLGINGDDQVKIYRKKGCPACNNTGYKGRIAIYEIMTVNRELRDLISKNVNSGVIKDVALKSGMRTLRDNCMRLVQDGVTTVEEMLRVTFSKE
ncbi:MAG TPA: ATPase, T2SS/T4P/T4SS family [Clostridia bacterium]